MPTFFPVFPLQVTFTEHVSSNEFLYFLGSRFYTYFFGFASVSTWYGIWLAVDKLVEQNLNVILAIIIISYFGLALTRTSLNMKAPPFTIITDSKEGYFDAPTYFRNSQHVSYDYVLH